MLKNFLLLCLCSLLLPQLLPAQSPEIVRSQPFEEPTGGANKLLLMKNGNTLHFHFTRKDGIEVVVYDNKHQAAPMVTNEVTSWNQKKMSDIRMEGLYEMNGQAVVFLIQYEKKRAYLFRFIFDGNTGKLLKEEAISDASIKGPGSDQSTLIEEVVPLAFFVRKDPESEYYAIAFLTSFDHGLDRRLSVIHYSPDHKVLKGALYEPPTEAYKHVDFREMYVHRDEFVFLSSYAYNAKGIDGKAPRVMISRMNKDAREFEHKLLDYTEGYGAPAVGIKYNKANKTLYMLTVTNTKSKKDPYTMYDGSRGLILQMNVIDPYALTVKNKYFIDHPQLSEYAKAHLNYTKPYYGTIQDFRINNDNTITLMYEELETYVNVSSTHVSAIGRLGDIGLTRINEDGREMTGSYAIVKEQSTNGGINPFFVYRRMRSGWTFYKGLLGAVNDHFFSYDYMFANNKDYVIYNAFPASIVEDNESFRPKSSMVFVSAANTMLAYYDGNTVKKTYLFGKPENEDVSRFSVLEMNTHSEDNKSFATMMIERRGKSKKAYIVWITF